MPKRDLDFRTPLLNAAGMLGFAPDFRRPDFRSLGDFGSVQLGAFVTNPLSWRARKPTAHPALVEYPGGFLLHTGLPNPGLSAAVKKYARKWADSSLPIIVHLMADRPEETARMVESLEGLENVMAAELGFAPLLTDDIILAALEMSLGELPLIVCLPHEQVLRLGPQALALVRDAARVGIPVIGSGGVWKPEQAEAMKEAGAIAVQLDAVLWRGGFQPASSQDSIK